MQNIHHYLLSIFIVLLMSSCTRQQSLVPSPTETSFPQSVDTATTTTQPVTTSPPSAQPTLTVRPKTSALVSSVLPTAKPVTPTPQTTSLITPHPSPPSNMSMIRTDYSEGTCSQDAQCTWAGQGCGGGHGVCTNNPKKYDGMMSTCEINDNHPSNQGFSCGCITAQNRCGWKM